MTKSLLLGFGFLMISVPVFSQILKPYKGYEFQARKDRIDIPFQYENNLIVIEVVLNQIFPLKFIFDTGAEHTILTRREITDLLSINYQRKFTLYGADLETELIAYLARGVSLEMSNLRLNNRSILVLEEDYFNFDEFSGLDIHGIIGADIFRRYVVQINFSKKIISLYPVEKFRKPNNKFTAYPIEIYRGKPYLNTTMLSPKDSTIQIKLLVDSGSALPLIIYPESAPELELPENVLPAQLGRGLGGFLEGFIGRVNAVQVGSTTFRDIICSFQGITHLADSAYTNDRNGILGNQSLENFNLIIDYFQEILYLQPIHGKKPPKFNYDKSGLFIIAGGNHINKFKVASVIPGSPADLAGIKKEDDLKKINGLSCNLLSMANINRKFKKREGKKMTIVYIRDGKRYKTTFRLKELI